MQKFALTLFKAFPFAALYQTAIFPGFLAVWWIVASRVASVLCQTARPCTARIPAKPDNIQHPLTGAYTHFTRFLK